MNAWESLQAAIWTIHACESSHYESVPITEREENTVVWQGVVEVFQLKNHPTAKRCYAWKQTTPTGGNHFVAILKISPVDSPRRAVKEVLRLERTERQSSMSSLRSEVATNESHPAVKKSL
ncbi:MAG: hypothetical protein U0798_19435 [Gemmataceae bacterium]